MKKNVIIPEKLRKKAKRVCMNFFRNKGDLQGEICLTGEQTTLRIKVRTCFREFTDVNEIEIDNLGREICTQCGFEIHRTESKGTQCVLDFKLAA